MSNGKFGSMLALGLTLAMVGCAPLEDEALPGQPAYDDTGSSAGEAADPAEIGSTTQALQYGKRGFATVHPYGDLVSLWSFNQAGGSITSTRTALGVYVVKFGKLGNPDKTTDGNVQVQAMGATPDRCKAYSFSSGGTTTETIKVVCHTPAGDPVDSYFTVQFARPGSNSHGAYALVPNGSASQTGIYEADSDYSWSSIGDDIEIQHSVTGKYTAYFWGFGGDGSPKVSAFGNNAKHCNVQNGFVVVGAYFALNINCFDVNGRLADSGFSVEMFGNPGVYDQGATVFANRPTTASYTPIGYNSGHYGPPCTAQDDPRANKVTKLDSLVGYYAVDHQSLPADDSIGFITAQGGNEPGANMFSSYCKPVSWWPYNGGTRVYVQCYSGWGERTNAVFTEVYEHSQMRTPC